MDTKQVARQYRLKKWSALITERETSSLKDIKRRFFSDNIIVLQDLSTSHIT